MITMILSKHLNVTLVPGSPFFATFQIGQRILRAQRLSLGCMDLLVQGSLQLLVPWPKFWTMMACWLRPFSSSEQT